MLNHEHNEHYYMVNKCMDKTNKGVISYLVCQALSTSGWHQNKYIKTTHRCINHLSLIGAKRMIPKYFPVIGLKQSTNVRRSWILLRLCAHITLIKLVSYMQSSSNGSLQEMLFYIVSPHLSAQRNILWEYYRETNVSILEFVGNNRHWSRSVSILNEFDDKFYIGRRKIKSSENLQKKLKNVL